MDEFTVNSSSLWRKRLTISCIRWQSHALRILVGIKHSLRLDFSYFCKIGRRLEDPYHLGNVQQGTSDNTHSGYHSGAAWKWKIFALQNQTAINPYQKLPFHDDVWNRGDLNFLVFALFGLGVQIQVELITWGNFDHVQTGISWLPQPLQSFNFQWPSIGLRMSPILVWSKLHLKLFLFAFTFETTAFKIL